MSMGGHFGYVGIGDPIGGGVSLDTLTETVTLDLNAQTIRQTGFISGSSVPCSSVWASSYPLSGQQIPFSLTITQSLREGGMSFDTGTQPLTWDSVSQSYKFDGRFTGAVPVDGSYSLTTGGEILTGSFSYDLTPATTLQPRTYSGLMTGAGQAITLIPSSLYPQQYVSPGSHGVIDVTAANGVHLVCIPGYATDQWDWLNWGVDSVTLVPEPSVAALAGLGAIALMIFRRRS